MRFRFSILLSAAFAFSVAFAPSLSAQGRRMGMGKHSTSRPQKAGKVAETPLEQFERMSPKEQQKALAKLPPERRRRMEGRLQTLRSLPPEQRSNLMAQYGRFSELSPERQEAVRNAWKEFGTQPPDRKQAMREELRSLGDIPAAERQTRLNNPEVRGKFSPQEQQILKDMSDVLPPE